ncbi:MAG: hypothetical protein DRI22_02075 [Caldiserica bacterium]|nr:MAG: hypothetical protein DRI22_02075 [Caldisericota bacterium]
MRKIFTLILAFVLVGSFWGIGSLITDSNLPVTLAKDNLVYQTITLTSPTGGETWPAGGLRQIKWTTSVSSGYGVSIFYSIDGGSNWTFIDCVPVTSTHGSYTWSIPSGINTTHAKIKVLLKGGCGGISILYDGDESGNFTIKPAGTPPSSPTNLTGTIVSCHQVDLSWNDNSSDEDSFIVERKESSGSYSVIATLPANTTSYSDTTVSAETTYYYRVKAHNSWGDSGYSNVVNITTPACGTPPAAPTNLTATPASSDTIELSWTDNSDNEDGFRIERKEAGGTYSEIATLPANTTSYTDTGLNPETTYYYRVRAYNSFGTSGYSNEAHATTPPAGTTPTSPSNLTAEATSPTEVSLSWTDNSDNEDGFKLERKQGSGPFSVIATLPPNTTTYTDTGLTPETTYTYRVRAYNSYGYSPYSNEVTVKTPNESPPPPPPIEQIIIRLYIGKTYYYVNDELLEMDVAPIIREGRTLLPIRYVAEALGATVGWNGEEQKVTITFKGTTIELWIGKNTAKVNGEYKLIDPTNPNVKPIIIPPGRTMLPIRFIAENLGCKVDWDPNLREVKITYPEE